MGYFFDSFRAMGETMKNFFRQPTTVQFPVEKRERAERFRTSFALLHDDEGDELCIGCLACERICPSQVITVDKAGKRESPVTGKKRAYADDLTLDLNACIFCELCIQVCPTDALVMLRVQDEPQFSREALFMSMEKLYANEKKEHSWGLGTTLVEMQNPKRGEPKAEKKPKAKAAAPAEEVKAAAPAEEVKTAAPAEEVKAAAPAEEVKAAAPAEEVKAVAADKEAKAAVSDKEEAAPVSEAKSQNAQAQTEPTKEAESSEIPKKEGGE